MRLSILVGVIPDGVGDDFCRQFGRYFRRAVAKLKIYKVDDFLKSTGAVAKIALNE